MSVFCSFQPKSRMSDVKIQISWRAACKFLVAVSLIYGTYLLGTTTPVAKGNTQMLFRFRQASVDMVHEAQLDACKTKCRAQGSESLPAQMVDETTNFRLHSVSGSQLDTVSHQKNLLAIPVGIEQKYIVDRVVTKFLLCDFVVMLFHYDGVIDDWYDFAWSDRVAHVAAMNQTKWWFAKRFLHPGVVVDYDHIFLWDEDIGIDYFSPKRYLSIIKEEGLEISQPALDPVKSYRVHHGITARNKESRVHRRVIKFSGRGKCYDNSTAPPCTGWVELMVPVFSRKAWRCTWYMIQNDLIHAWGLDKQLGYCAQGDRAKNVGVVDSEYVVHLGFPTLGTSHAFKASEKALNNSSTTGNLLNLTMASQSASPNAEFRFAVREQSSLEMKIFEKRWNYAALEDQCWNEPYPNSTISRRNEFL